VISRDPAVRVWQNAAATVAWLFAIITPAIAFNITTDYSSDIDLQFKAFFCLVMTILFIVVWKSSAISKPSLLVILLPIAAVLFVSYAMLKQSWTCSYGPVKVVTGYELSAGTRAFFASHGIPEDDCLQVLSAFGGNARRVWPVSQINVRFMSLFGAYSAAWTMVALCVLVALRTRLRR